MIGDFDSDIPALRELVRDLAALDLSEGPAALIAKLITFVNRARAILARSMDTMPEGIKRP